MFVLYERARSLPQGQPQDAEDGADSPGHHFSLSQQKDIGAAHLYKLP